MIYSRIVGTGSHLPGDPVSNRDLISRGIETSDEWIADRTGIRFRHFAADGVGSSDLALEASRQAIASAEIDAATIDLIIVATSTPDVVFLAPRHCCRTNSVFAMAVRRSMFRPFAPASSMLSQRQRSSSAQGHIAAPW